MSNAEQALSAVAGGVIGFFVGGPAGAVAGFQYGLLAGSLLFPTQLPGVTGPRLEDFERAEADPGAAVWKCFGRVAVPGFRMYLGPVTEISTTEEVGGKGGPTQEVTTYTYTQTIALGLCEGVIEGVSRIWENGKLVYDVRGQQAGEGVAGTPFGIDDYTILNAVWPQIRVAAQWSDINWAAHGYPSGNPISAAGNAIMEKLITINTIPLIQVQQWTIVNDAALFTDINWGALGYDDSFDERVAASAAYADTFTLYTGTEEQLPDPTLELEQGTGNVPAFRGLAYIVFPDRVLKDDQALRHPQFKIELGGGQIEEFVQVVNLDATQDGGVDAAAGLVAGVTLTGFYPGDILTVRRHTDNPTWLSWSPWGAPVISGPQTGTLYYHSIVKDNDTSQVQHIGQGAGPYDGYAAGAAAFDAAYPDGYELTGNTTYTFYIQDTPINDNSGGLSLSVSRLGIAEGDVSSTSIASIVTALCASAGVTDIDVTDLADVYVVGYAVTNVMSALSAINPLRMVGLFDYVESGETMRFPVRGAAAVATIPAEDLGPAFAQESKPPAITTRKLQDVELPLQIRLRYLSEARDYERGEQLSPARIGTVGINLVDVDCPVVLEDDRAAQLAEIIFREAWASRWSHSFQLAADYHHLEPADCIVVPIDERNYRLRITRVQESGLILRKFEAVRDDDGSYTSTAVATPPQREPSTLEQLGLTEATLLDLPALQDSHDDPGFYWTTHNDGPGSAWPGAVLHKSIDAGVNYSPIGSTAAEGSIGTVVSHPAAGDTHTWDNDGEIVLDMITGSLESRTDLAVVNGANTLAIGAHGRWHVVQFAQAELIAVNRYRLTRLLLGRRGTEHLIGSVQVGDVAVLVSGSGMFRHVLQEAEIGASRIYRAVTSGAPFSTGADQTFAGAGMALETFSPTYVRGSRAGDDLTITWLRRDRLSQTLRNGIALPLNEASEAYEVDVMNGVNVVRTISATTETVTYTGAQQTTDFGSPQASVSVRIYQLSATVGRGTPAEATL